MVIESELEQIRKILARRGERSTVNVLFVCLGNICRSPAAEGVMEELIRTRHENQKWTVDSCGTGNYHIGDLPDHRMRIHARRRGLELTHICRQINQSDFDRFDLIIPMDESNSRNLLRMSPSPESDEKIIPMSSFFSLATRFDYVPDPYYEGAEGFELVLDLLQDAIVNLADTVDEALKR